MPVPHRRLCPRFPWQRRLLRYRKTLFLLLLVYTMSLPYQFNLLDFWQQEFGQSYKGPLYVVYQCDSTVSCGGLADKQKGIVGAYVLSQMMGRSFGLRVTSPCDITRKYLPNTVDWRMDPMMLEKVKTESVVFLDEKARNFGRTLPLVDFNEVYSEPVLSVTTNLDWTRYLSQNMLYAPRSTLLSEYKDNIGPLYRRALRELFSLSPGLRARLENFKRTIAGQKLVCAHVRVLNTNPKLNWASRTPTDVGEEGLILLWDFLLEYMKQDYMLFMQSDSDDIFQEAEKRFPNNIVGFPREGLYTEPTLEEVACDEEDTALLEQEALTFCDVIVLSPSDVGMIGTWLGARTDDIFCLANYTMKPCPKPSLDYLFMEHLW